MNATEPEIYLYREALRLAGIDPESVVACDVCREDGRVKRWLIRVGNRDYKLTPDGRYSARAGG